MANNSNNAKGNQSDSILMIPAFVSFSPSDKASISAFKLGVKGNSNLDCTTRLKAKQNNDLCPQLEQISKVNKPYSFVSCKVPVPNYWTDDGQKRPPPSPSSASPATGTNLASSRSAPPMSSSSGASSQPASSSGHLPNHRNGIRSRRSHSLIDESDLLIFKHLKRIYSLLLLVAMIYALAHIFTLIVFYKSLPETPSALALQSDFQPYRQEPYRKQTETAEQAKPTEEFNLLASPKEGVGIKLPNLEKMKFDNDHGDNVGIDENPKRSSVHEFHHRFHHRTYEVRRQLDQAISINFLVATIYLFAFYAAQREYYRISLAFHIMLFISMFYSIARVLIEKVDMAHCVVGLMMRSSIVFIGWIYLRALKRARSARFIRSLDDFDPILNGYITTTSVNIGMSGDFDPNKDLPPKYDEALECPTPIIT